jgi:hypothetical protein
MMAQIVYVLCGLTSVLCAGLLYRQYRSSCAPLLFWSTWCFVCLALTNVLLFVDLVLFPEIDMLYVRSVLTLTGMLMLIYGLIRERN